MGIPKNEIAFREYLQRFKGQNLSDDDEEVIERFYTNRGISDVRAKAIRKEVLGDGEGQGISSVPTYIEGKGVSSTAQSGGSNPSSDQTTDVPSSKQGEQGDSSTAGTSGSGNDSDKDRSDPGRPDLKSIAVQVAEVERSPSYLANLKQYGQVYFKNLVDRKGALPSEKVLAEFNDLREQLELDSEDTHQIETEMLRKYYLDGKRDQEGDDSDDGLGEPAGGDEDDEISNVEEYNPDLKPLFNELEESLNKKNLEKADKITFEILRQVIQPRYGWFDDAALRRFNPENSDKQAIQELDRLWRQKTKRFGFGYQLKLYGLENVVSQESELDRQQNINRDHALQFSKQVEWWIPRLNFFKFYRSLDFSMSGPIGHLPAFWFWEIPGKKAFQHGGIWFLRERGGCGVDAFIIPAFMLMLKNAGIQPVSPESMPSSVAPPTSPPNGSFSARVRRRVQGSRSAVPPTSPQNRSSTETKMPDS